MARRTYTLVCLVTLALTHPAVAQNPTISLIPLVDDVRRECVGGPNEGQTCTTAADCEVGPECQRTCDVFGPNGGQPCDSTTDCDGTGNCIQECFCNRVVQAVPGEVITIEVMLANWSPNGEQLKAWEALVEMRSATHVVLPVGWDHPTGISHDCFSDASCTTLCVGGGRLEGFNCTDDIDCGEGTCSEPSPFPICSIEYGGCIGPNHDPSLGAFVDTSRSDYVFFGLTAFEAVDTSTLKYRFAGGLLFSSDSIPYTGPRYCATLMLEVLPSIGESASLLMDTIFGGSKILNHVSVKYGPMDTEGLTIEVVEPPQPAERIPATSTWGVVVLSLILLTGAKVYFGRKAAA